MDINEFKKLYDELFNESCDKLSKRYMKKNVELLHILGKAIKKEERKIIMDDINSDFDNFEGEKEKHKMTMHDINKEWCEYEYKIAGGVTIKNMKIKIIYKDEDEEQDKNKYYIGVISIEREYGYEKINVEDNNFISECLGIKNSKKIIPILVYWKNKHIKEDATIYIDVEGKKNLIEKMILEYEMTKNEKENNIILFENNYPIYNKNSDIIDIYREIFNTFTVYNVIGNLECIIFTFDNHKKMEFEKIEIKMKINKKKKKKK